MIISSLQPHITHDAASESDRRPIGAVRAGQSVRLGFRDGAAAVLDAELVLSGDGFERRYKMALTGGRWYCDLVPSTEPAALWYCFCLRLEEGEFWLCAANGGRFGQLQSSRGSAFRLTVYDAAFETPAWFRRSVMYQIFPTASRATPRTPPSAALNTTARAGGR